MELKLSYIDTDSFIAHIKTEDIHWNNAKHVKTKFRTSNYELDRTLSKGKNKKNIGLMKHELRGKIMTEFAALRPKTSSYLTNDNNETKKAKDTKSVS